MKTCPYCAEEIQDAAIVCRFCGRNLAAANPVQQEPVAIQGPKTQPRKQKENNRDAMQTIRQFPSWFSKQKLSGKLFIGCSGLFILFCLCSFPFSILSSATPTPEIMDVSSIQTTAFETVMSGVNQTATVSAPTNTPEPTYTPTPIPSSTPTPDLNKQIFQPTLDTYGTLISLRINNYNEAFADLSEFTEQIANDASLAFDKDWKMELGFALGELNFQADEMVKLEPSPRYVKFHSILVKLANETHLYIDDYAKGVDNFDGALIEKANQHLSNMTTLTQEAILEREKINATP